MKKNEFKKMMKKENKAFKNYYVYGLERSNYDFK